MGLARKGVQVYSQHNGGVNTPNGSSEKYGNCTIVCGSMSRIRRYRCCTFPMNFVFREQVRELGNLQPSQLVAIYRYISMAAGHAQSYLRPLRSLHIHMSRAQPARLRIRLAPALLTHFACLHESTAIAACAVECHSTVESWSHSSFQADPKSTPSCQARLHPAL